MVDQMIKSEEFEYTDSIGKFIKEFISRHYYKHWRSNSTTWLITCQEKCRAVRSKNVKKVPLIGTSKKKRAKLPCTKITGYMIFPAIVQ